MNIFVMALPFPGLSIGRRAIDRRNLGYVVHFSVMVSAVGLMLACLLWHGRVDAQETAATRMRAALAEGRFGEFKKLGDSEFMRRSNEDPVDAIELTLFMLEACAKLSDVPCVRDVYPRLGLWTKLPREQRVADRRNNRILLRWAILDINLSVDLPGVWPSEFAAEARKRSIELLSSYLARVPQAARDARIGIALAQGMLAERNYPQADFFLDRAWAAFLASKGMDRSTFVDLLPRFIQLFRASGQQRRAVTAFAIAGRRLVEFTEGIYLPPSRPDEIVTKLLGATVGIDDGSDTKRAIERLTLAIPAIRSSGREEEAHASALGYLLASAVFICANYPNDKCDIDSWAKELLSLIRKSPKVFTDNVQRGAPAALALASYSFAKNQPVPADVDQLLNAASAGSTDSEFAGFPSAIAVVAGRGMTAVARRDLAAASSHWNQAADLVLARERRRMMRQPFDLAPMDPFSQAVLQAGLFAAVENGQLRADRREFVIEASRLLNGSQLRSESRLVYLEAKVVKASARKPLRTINQTYLRRLALERLALEDLKEAMVPRFKQEEVNGEKVMRLVPPEPRAFDERLFKELSDAAGSIASQADTFEALRMTATQFGEGELSQLQRALTSDEVFVSALHIQLPNVPQFGSIAKGAGMALCVRKGGVELLLRSFDPERYVVDSKLVRAALTRSGAPDTTADASFPIDAALRLTSVAFGDPGKCLGDARVVILDTSQFDSAVPAHVFIDPSWKGERSSALQSTPWLGTHRAIIVTAGSLQLIGSRAIPNDHQFASEFLGVGNPQLAGNTLDGVSRRSVVTRGMSDEARRSLKELSALPETEDELKALAKLFGPTSRVLVREAASKGAVRREALSNYRVMSFATHGLSRDEVPGLSEPALLLTPQESNSTDDDGLLTASEIAGFDLRADLVFLSACNSGRFAWKRIDSEVAGLSSAFFLAGARSTFASLWSVDSKATQELMQMVAEEVTSNVTTDKAEAVRRALKRFVEHPTNAAYSHPRFWAAFVLFGDGRSASAGR